MNKAGGFTIVGDQKPKSTSLGRIKKELDTQTTPPTARTDPVTRALAILGRYGDENLKTEDSQRDAVLNLFKASNIFVYLMASTAHCI